jgi:hypothetical protein
MAGEPLTGGGKFVVRRNQIHESSINERPPARQPSPPLIVNGYF